KGEELPFEKGDWIFVPDARTKLAEGAAEYQAFVISGTGVKEITLNMDPLTDDEKDIILKGCLINYYRA
ncbi:MAG: hypothetical protein Q4A51_03885, partial [Lachnospiraceae bacterium]|nr:hypothetical protein [Lachnospiraceae bacterium]